MSDTYEDDYEDDDPDCPPDAPLCDHFSIADDCQEECECGHPCNGHDLAGCKDPTCETGCPIFKDKAK